MSTTVKSDAECEAAIQEFVSITKVNEAVAHSVLQNVDFNLEDAIVRYYSELDNGPLPDMIINEVLGVDSNEVPTEEGERHLKRPNKARIDDVHQTSNKKQSRLNDHFKLKLSPSSSKESDAQVLESPSSTIDKSVSHFPPEFTAMSYNVDGIDDKGLQTRFLGVLHVVAKVNPDVVFFQEVVYPIEDKLKQVLGPMYNIFTACCPSHLAEAKVGQCSTPYYIVTAVSKNIKIEKREIVRFNNSQMARNMLCVEAKWHDLNIRLINTHLESCWQFSEERRKQFKQVMDIMKVYADMPNTFTLFGGDLNLRDTEVSNVPQGVQDVWVATGCVSEFKYTWDTKLNDNHETKRPVRNRFDRFYVKTPYQKMNFYLAGKQRIQKINMFPSDHFAIVCKFSAPQTI